MTEKQKQHTIEFLKSIMSECATLLQELENPAEKDVVPSMWTPRQELLKDLDYHVLSCELVGDWWHLKIKYVSKEVFSQFASAIRAMNGKYVSAGKNSEFQIPNKKA